MLIVPEVFWQTHFLEFFINSFLFLLKFFFLYADIIIGNNEHLQKNYKEYCMKEEIAAEKSVPEVYFDMNNGEFVKIDMSLPLQMLFDDVMTFVSKTEI